VGAERGDRAQQLAGLVGELDADPGRDSLHRRCGRASGSSRLDQAASSSSIL
jgi:hypothetical protein